MNLWIKIVSVLSATLGFTLLLSWTNAYAIESPTNPTSSVSSNLSSTAKDVHFAAAGDWGCKAATQSTVSYIKSKNPDLVLGLGDFSYQNDTGCWFKLISPLLNKNRIVIELQVVS